MNEKNFSGLSGAMLVLMLLIVLTASAIGFVIQAPIAGVALAVAALFLLPGFTVVNPNESVVLVLFGSYKGTLRTNGFYWVNPFFCEKENLAACA
jgi:regulator of protease activity HflC (stomatin/prohibitin superfamily)